MVGMLYMLVESRLEGDCLTAERWRSTWAVRLGSLSRCSRGIEKEAEHSTACWRGRRSI